MARKFFYVCAGILMLALSFHLGATSATAQFGTPVTGVISTSGGGGLVVMTSNGDCYVRDFAGGYPWSGFGPNMASVGNFWSGAPTPTQQGSWGQLKSRYAPNGGQAKPQTNDR